MNDDIETEEIDADDIIDDIDDDVPVNELDDEQDSEIYDEPPLNIYIVAGEASGDLLGAHLMRSLRTQMKQREVKKRRIFFSGVGGDKMTAQGLETLFPCYELSLMGFVEILPYILRTMARIDLVVQDIMLKQPDMIITIDSPGFCFRVVKKLRKQGLKSKFVHYVAPTVWAYKPERAGKCKKLFDHLLLLLPFEKPYFDEVGLPCTFVGHPVVCETKTGDGAAFRAKYEISDRTTLFCLLPGSRTSEIDRHMPIFTRAVAMLATLYPSITLVLAVPEYAMNHLFPYLNTSPFRIIIAENEEDKRNAMAASQFAFVKSGTVALEAAMANVPMLVTYKVNSLSAWWLRRMITTKYANLINVLLGKEIIPELLQENASPITLASCASTILRYKEMNYKQKEAINQALKLLLPESDELPSDIAATKILSLL